MIEGCNSYIDAENCLTCQEGAGLKEDNTCVNLETIEEKQNYYKDENTNKYISCSTLANCITCISSSVCTSFQEGFSLENNRCGEKNDDDNGGLSTDVIVCIVCGCLLFILIFFLVIYFF